MSKFVYHSNGKITRIDMTGIPIMSTKVVSSLSASNDGNYIIVKTGDTIVLNLLQQDYHL